MHLIHLLREGLVSGIQEKPLRHVETVMSDVFIYDDVVRKVFKHDKPGVFLDLRDPTVRLAYTKEDFDWNKDVSPEIHRAIYGVKESDGTYILCAPEEGKAWFMEMTRIDDSDTLFQRLLDGTATTHHVKTFAESQTKHIDALTTKYLSQHQDLLDLGLYTLWEKRLDEDLRSFGAAMGSTISAEQTRNRIDTLLQFMRSHHYFSALDVQDATITVDNHAGNVVFHNDIPQFIDIFLVKREWRLIDRNNNIARIATCVRTLGGDELADAMYETYATLHVPAPKEIARFQEAYNGFIKGYYYTYLKKPDIALRYFDQADATLESL